MVQLTRKRRSQGQFLLISSVIIGLMIIGTSSTIAEIQSREFSHDSVSYHVNAIEYEARKVEMSSAKQRESFREMVDSLPGYTSNVQAWDKGSDGSFDCFNVTLEKPGARLRVNCVG